MLTEKDILIGADPEFFISDDGKNPDCIPPILLEESGLNILRQEFRDGEPDIVSHSYYYDDKDLKIMSDGAAMELTVKPSPLNNLGDLYERIQEGYRITKGLITPFNLDISVISTIPFQVNLYNTEKYKVACQAGCDRDEDAWDNSFKCETLDISQYSYRHGGGHIHLGIIPTEQREYIKELAKYVVRFLSMTVGSYFLINSSQPELDSIRMNYYGKPGKYRIQNHGIEYRSPSNAWTTNKDIFINSREWLFIGLNLIFHENAEVILDKYGKEFVKHFSKRNTNELKNIMEGIREEYYA